MPSHRSLRMAEAIREVVSSAILFEVSDPRVRAVTVLRAEVTGDLRSAVVYVSIMGNEPERKQSMAGLKSATGFLQARMANRLQTRFTPVLSFRYDDSVKKSVDMSKLIEETLAADRQVNPPKGGLADKAPTEDQAHAADLEDPEDDDEDDDEEDDD